MSEVPPTTNDEESILTKYKRLLTLARSSLESNQATIAAKDKQINQLTIALEEEKSTGDLLRQKNKPKADIDESSPLPRSILRRVDVPGQCIWILVEYEGEGADSWLRFDGDDELDDFIQRLPGAPLTVPPRSLTESESASIESEAKSKVDRIVEEYRRYKVRVEIARKQKESDFKILAPGALGDYLPSSTTGANTGTQGSMDFNSYEQEMSKWVRAYESLSRENEQLRTQNSDSLLIKKWQDRYEECLKEKEELLAKLKVFSRLSEVNQINNMSGSGSGSRPGTLTTGALSSGSGPLHSDRRTPEQMFIDLMDEYKEYRRRVEALLMQRKEEVSELRGIIESNGLSDLLHTSDSGRTSGSSSTSNGNNNSGGGRVGYNGPNSMSNSYQLTSTSGPMVLNFQDSKIMYIRQMFLQYLSCRDEVVRPHIQSALIAMFRFNEQERGSIEEATKVEAPLEETLTAISSFFESFTGAAMPLSV